MIRNILIWMTEQDCSGISDFSESSVSSLFSHAGAVNFSEGCGCLLFFMKGYMIIMKNILHAQ